MALKLKVTQKEFDTLPKEIQAEYHEKDGAFTLDVTGIEDNGSLIRANQRNKIQREEAEARVKELETENNDLRAGRSNKDKDVETLTKEHKKQLGETSAAYELRIAKLTEHTTKTLIDGVANSIAGKISKAPKLLLPHIKSRLQANFEGDEPTTVVLDAQGKPSKMTIEELQAEIVADKEFSAIIVTSQASGGAGNRLAPINAGGGANQNNNQEQTVDLSKMKPSDLKVILQQKAATEAAAAAAAKA